MNKIFCPRCGDRLKENSNTGELWCETGDMSLSKEVEKQIQNFVESDAHKGQPMKFKIGGTWFCPADASTLKEHDSILECPACHRTLPPGLIYQLVEVHPHENGGDGA